MVDAFQAMRGVGFVAAVICVAELGDLPRFDHLTKEIENTQGGSGIASISRPSVLVPEPCWRDDWPFPLISEKCRQLSQGGSPFLVHRYKAAAYRVI